MGVSKPEEDEDDLEWCDEDEMYDDLEDEVRVNVSKIKFFNLKTKTL